MRDKGERNQHARGDECGQCSDQREPAKAERVSCDRHGRGQAASDLKNLIEPTHPLPFERRRRARVLIALSATKRRARMLTCNILHTHREAAWRRSPWGRIDSAAGPALHNLHHDQYDFAKRCLQALPPALFANKCAVFILRAVPFGNYSRVARVFLRYWKYYLPNDQ